MKPDHTYNRSITLIENQTYLSLVKDDTSGELMSSVIYEYDEDIGNQVLLLHQETMDELESDEEQFIDNHPEESNEKQKSMFSVFGCCLSKNKNDTTILTTDKIDGKAFHGRHQKKEDYDTPSLVELSDERSFASEYSA